MNQPKVKRTRNDQTPKTDPYADFENGLLKEIELPGSQPLQRLKREKFCQEYLIDLSVPRAGDRAGYTNKNGHSYVYQLMKEQEILDRISYLKWKRTKRVEVSQEAVIRELANIAFFNVKNLYHADGTLKSINSLTRAEAAAITGLGWKGKQQALVQLGKHLGLFKENAALTDPLIYELRQRKELLADLPEEDLIALSAIMRRAMERDKSGDDGRNGSGNYPGGEVSKALH